jgi:hypothetical protein
VKLPRNPINGWIVASVPQPERYNAGWFPPIKWCEERFKEQNWRYVSEGVFEFRRHDDHLMFLLRWA